MSANSNAPGRTAPEKAWPGLDESRKAALQQRRRGKPALVWSRIVADTLTPVAAALRLMKPGRGDFLLESVEGGEARGRYSLLGLDPDLVFRAEGNAASINRDWRTDRSAFAPCEGSALDGLRTVVDEARLDVPPELPPALAFVVGYFGYETIALMEDIAPAPANPPDLPDMMFVRPTVLCVFDTIADTLYCIAPAWRGSDDPDLGVDAAAVRVAETLAKLRREPPDPPPSPPPAPAPGPAPGFPATTAVTAPPAYTARTEPAAYRAMVERAQEYIRAGDIFQVVLSQKFSAPFPLPPFDLYRALRRVNPSPFLFFLDLPDFALVGSSPEILVRVRGGEVTIRPIAGTRPRGADALDDKRNEAELLADPKERAEHLMLLDLGRNDVGRVARGDSVRVTDSYSVERYSHVMHIVSNVVGQLAPGRDAIDALFAGFPAGTVSGAPKLRACQIICELEAERRGAYAGGVGYFAPDGGLDSCIVLRTAVVKDDLMHVQAGAGIVADSDPDLEQAECEAKAGALLAAARAAFEESAMRGNG